MTTYCTLQKYDPYHVRCINCGRRLSGGVDQEILCRTNGEANTVGCCGRARVSPAASARYGEKVMVVYIGGDELVSGNPNLLQIVGEVSALRYGYKNRNKPFCLYKIDADAQPSFFEITGACK
jgi:hypothetical protein